MLSGRSRSIPDSYELLYDRAMAAERIDQLDVVETDLRRVIQHEARLRARLQRARLHARREDRPPGRGAGAHREGATSSRPRTRSSSTAWAGCSTAWATCDEALKQPAERLLVARPIPRSPRTWARCCGRAASATRREKIWRAALTENPDHESLLAVMQKYSPKARSARSAVAMIAAASRPCSSLRRSPPAPRVAAAPLPRLDVGARRIRDDRAPLACATASAARSRSLRWTRTRGGDVWVISSPAGQRGRAHRVAARTAPRSSRPGAPAQHAASFSDAHRAAPRRGARPERLARVAARAGRRPAPVGLEASPSTRRSAGGRDDACQAPHRHRATTSWCGWSSTATARSRSSAHAPRRPGLPGTRQAEPLPARGGPHGPTATTCCRACSRSSIAATLVRLRVRGDGIVRRVNDAGRRAGGAGPGGARGAAAAGRLRHRPRG